MADRDDATPRRDDTDDPRRSRERAVKILFQADVRHADAVATLEALLDDPRARALLDEADDLTDGTPLLPPIAHEPGVEVEWIRDDPATSRSSDPAVEGATAGSASPGGRPGRRGEREGSAGDEQLDGFTRSLVLGVYEHRARIDELVGRFARRWQISRMPIVDRTVLRMATYELLHQPTSPAVVIDEAVTLAKQLSTDDSGRYVNGVLESIRKHLRDVPQAPEDAEVEAEPEALPSDAADADSPAAGRDAVGEENTAAGSDVADTAGDEADATTGDSSPDDATPADSTPDDAATGDSTADDAATGDSTADDAATGDSSPDDATPADSTPDGAATGDSRPDDATPADSRPDDATPADSTPDVAAPDHAEPGASAPDASRAHDAPDPGSDAVPGDERSA